MNDIFSSIIDNYKSGKVSDFLLENIDKDSKLSIVSAYFTIYAFHHLKDKLKEIKSLDFLFGEPPFIQTLDTNKKDYQEFSIVDDKLVISQEKQLRQKAIAKECSDWIKDKVNIKSMVKPNFLHGKMYHIIKSNGVQKATLGSSNFTVKGLGLTESHNIELNLKITDDRDKKNLLDWFVEV